MLLEDRYGECSANAIRQSKSGHNYIGQIPSGPSSLNKDLVRPCSALLEAA
jgi:hypothetical protein